ncbi:hypothetical protein COO60DRAFT_1476928 [Scenedesmus sp. NREL 46B-D3]|nr:hypothetical protein COO60DRAFT_1476928 [Scenedesmus sp. NREL 46B-D3]
MLRAWQLQWRVLELPHPMRCKGDQQHHAAGWLAAASVAFKLIPSPVFSMLAAHLQLPGLPGTAHAAASTQEPLVHSTMQFWHTSCCTGYVPLLLCAVARHSLSSPELAAAAPSRSCRRSSNSCKQQVQGSAGWACEGGGMPGRRVTLSCRLML